MKAILCSGYNLEKRNRNRTLKNVLNSNDDNVIRLISARKATKNEQKIYEKGW